MVNALGVRDGFGFSAGAIDYLLNYRIAERPLLLVLIGLVYAVIYYLLFRWVITRWNLRTPGREDSPEATEAALGADAAELVEAGIGASAMGPAGRVDAAAGGLSTSSKPVDVGKPPAAEE